MKTFEYKTITIKGDGFFGGFKAAAIDKKLNQFGAKGWELVTLNTEELGGCINRFFATLKRETHFTLENNEEESTVKKEISELLSKKFHS